MLSPNSPGRQCAASGAGPGIRSPAREARAAPALSRPGANPPRQFQSAARQLRAQPAPAIAGPIYADTSPDVGWERSLGSCRPGAGSPRPPHPQASPAEAVTSPPPGRNPGLESCIPPKSLLFSLASPFSSDQEKEPLAVVLDTESKKVQDAISREGRAVFRIKAELCALCLLGSPAVKLEENGSFCCSLPLKRTCFLQ